MMLNMGNSKGRHSWYVVLDKLFECDENDLCLHNIGGQQEEDLEPGVRAYTLDIAEEHVISPWTSQRPAANFKEVESTPTRVQPSRTAARDVESYEQHLSASAPVPIRRLPGILTPDVLLDTPGKDLFLVEVKSGDTFIPKDKNQLKYLMLPAAMSDGAVLGVLSNAQNAILYKCIRQTDQLVFLDRTYTYDTKEELVKVYKDLLRDIYYHAKSIQNTS